MFFTNARTRVINLTAAVAVAAGAMLSSPVQAYERWIYVQNIGGSEIVAIHTRGVGEEQWSRNLLRDDYIDMDETAKVEPRRHGGYCRFEMIVYYADGERVLASNINLCQETDVAFDEEGYYFI